MLGTHAMDQCACLLYLYQTSNPAIIATGSVDIFTIFMFDKAHMSETKIGQKIKSDFRGLENFITLFYILGYYDVTCVNTSVI